jgi:hypothetical protein
MERMGSEHQAEASQAFQSSTKHQESKMEINNLTEHSMQMKQEFKRLAEHQVAIKQEFEKVCERVFILEANSAGPHTTPAFGGSPLDGALPPPESPRDGASSRSLPQPGSQPSPRNHEDMSVSNLNQWTNLKLELDEFSSRLKLIEFNVNDASQAPPYLNEMRTFQRRAEEASRAQEGVMKDFAARLLECEATLVRCTGADLVDKRPPTDPNFNIIGRSMDQSLGDLGIHLEEDLVDDDHPSEDSNQRLNDEVQTTLKEILCTDFVFGESAWDASLFIFSPGVGNGASSLAAFSLLLSILLQVVFCLFVFSNLSESSFNDAELQGLRAWRAIVAHDERLVTAGRRLSLADRICSGDSTIDSSSEQAEKLEHVRSYLPDLDPHADSSILALPGWVICLLALSIWYLAISREIGSALDALRAFITVRREGEAKDETRIVYEGRALHLESISSGRLYFVSSLILVRLGMAPRPAKSRTYA